MAITDSCIHYWIIASPSGAKAPGKCKLCGAEKDFVTSYRFGPNEGKSTKAERHRSSIIAGRQGTISSKAWKAL